MAGVEEASTAAGAAGACTPAVEAGPTGGRIRRPLQATEVHLLQPLMLRGRRVGTLRGLVTAILDPTVISRLGISGLEIPPRRHLVTHAAVGIPLAAHLEAGNLRARNRKPGPPATQEVSMSLAGIAERDLLARRVAFRGRVAKSGRMVPQPRMLSPGLNRFPPFTVRSAVPPL